MLEPRAGLEPATCRLRIGCSTTELPRPLIIKDLLAHFCPLHKTAIKLPSVHFPIARDLVQNCSLPSRTAIIVRSNSAVLLQPYVTESDQTLAQGIRSTHSTSLSCPIANNVNRNNINTNNVNRNNINSSNYRANNFNNTSHNSNFTTPNFGTQHNQAQFRNTNGATLGQQAGAANRPNSGTQNRAQTNQQNRPQMAQNQSHSNLNQSQRGYGQQQRGTNSGAFSNYSAGGNARVNSARGQQSFSGERLGGGRRR